MLTDDFPQYITVLRRGEKFYPALMEWDKREERYSLKEAFKEKWSRAQAIIEAEALAKFLGLEYREPL